MSEKDPRAELRDVARRLRDVLVRERADGGAELLARSAIASRRRATVAPATKPAAPRRPEVVESARPAAKPEPAAARPATAPPAPTRVNLFGEVEAPPPSPPVAVLDDEPPRDATVALHSIDPAERLEIERASLAILDPVAAEIRACRACGLCEGRANAVPGVGSARSGIVFVGEAPGAEEDRRGEPFVGRAGELLTRIIQAMDDAHLIPGVPLTRETVYICNVLKCRPPENRNPLPHEVETCSPFLERQLAALEPRIICCLGKFAAELLVGVKGTIAGLRGRVYRYHGAKLIVTYHPAACLRNPNLKRPVWEDMQLLSREYASGE